MKSLVALVALLGLVACGQAADSSSPMDGADDQASPLQSSDAAPLDDAAAEPAAVVQHEPAAPTPAALPVEQAEPASAPVSPAVASPAADPVAPPAPAPAPSPKDSNDDPTPEHPLVIDCREDDCSACNADLRATHPDWYEAGAVSCQLRTCAADAACGSLGADLRCLRVDVAGPLVCRLPRLHEFAACDENAAENACEVGLLCSAGRCRKLP